MRELPRRKEAASLLLCKGTRSFGGRFGAIQKASTARAWKLNPQEQVKPIRLQGDGPLIVSHTDRVLLGLEGAEEQLKLKQQNPGVTCVSDGAEVKAWN